MMAADPLREAQRLPRLRPLWSRVARLAWVLFAGLFVLGLPALYASKLQPKFAESWPPGAYQAVVGQLGLSVGFVQAYYTLFDAGFLLLFVLTAGILVWRRPDDPTAVLVAFVFILFVPFLGSDVYRLPWLNVVVSILLVVGLILILNLFPNGRFVPHWLGWPALAVAALAGSALFLLPKETVYFTLALLMIFALALTGLGAQVYRYRRAAGRLEQQQIKVVMTGLAGFIILGMGYWGVSPALIPGFTQPSSLGYRLITYPLQIVGFSLLPLSVVFAILRYRLYDIDVLIRRALVYSTLTALLALAYLGSILALQAIVGVFAAGNNTPLVTVLSTLFIAALFVPLRRRVQATIDRRFYRRKYDAARTLAAFSAKLRDEVELAMLSDSLLAVVEETMQPESVGLWLRGPADTAVRTQPA
jgi:hypothetical protein